MNDQVLAASIILHNAAGEVLLQQRDDFPHLEYRGWWTVPGGYMEQGETPSEAIGRELFEEMELVIPFSYWREWETRRGEELSVIVRQHMFIGSLNQTVSDIPLHEGQAIRFFSQEQIAEIDLAFGFKPILAAYFEENTQR